MHDWFDPLRKIVPGGRVIEEVGKAANWEPGGIDRFLTVKTPTSYGILWADKDVRFASLHIANSLHIVAHIALSHRALH